MKKARVNINSFKADNKQEKLKFKRKGRKLIVYIPELNLNYTAFIWL